MPRRPLHWKPPSRPSCLASPLSQASLLAPVHVPRVADNARAYSLSRGLPTCLAGVGWAWCVLRAGGARLPALLTLPAHYPQARPWLPTWRERSWKMPEIRMLRSLSTA